jgi:mono/diheme cytochrome c family protein
MAEGEPLFARNCASCHGAEGNEELSSHVEILAGNSRAVGNASRMLRRIVHGGTYMPAIGAGLSDREVAAVATFVRNSWGNDHGLVTEEDVTGIR